MNSDAFVEAIIMKNANPPSNIDSAPKNVATVSIMRSLYDIVCVDSRRYSVTMDKCQVFGEIFEKN